MRAALAATFLILCAPALASGQSSPLGDWARGDGIAHVRIEPCGADLCAINTWIKPGVTDEKIGDRLVLSLKSNGAHWAGEAFDPQRNLHFNMSFDVGGSSMRSQGCIVGGLLCKSVAWTRIGQD
jgi:uncharacterized protein (DUF2147 family)